MRTTVALAAVACMAVADIGFDGFWGDWGSYVSCGTDQFICAMQARFQDYSANPNNDETALNGQLLKTHKI